MKVGRGIDAVIFDLFYTLVHPGTYPGGTGRVGWLAGMLGVDPTDLEARWAVFEPVLEAGQAPKHSDGLGPELSWVRAVVADLGVVVTTTDLARIEADWDLTRRQALLDPPMSAVATLVALREYGIRLGVLSNTHGLEKCAPGIDLPSPRTSMWSLSRTRSAHASRTRRPMRTRSAGSRCRLRRPRTWGTVVAMSWSVLDLPDLAWSSSLRRPRPSSSLMIFPAFEHKRMPR